MPRSSTRSRSTALVVILLASTAIAACGAESVDLGDGFLRPPHWLDSFPLPGATLAAPPAAIVVNFDFDLHATMSGAGVFVDEVELAARATVGADRRSLRIDLDGAGGPGQWRVALGACWPDGSCHEGQFLFRVDESARAEYADWTAADRVTVAMRQRAFVPEKLVVRAGTEVEWVNEEAPEHYVNSDPHPSHNLSESLNSPALELGDAHRFVFDTPGEWGIHCSAHAGMDGRVLVVP